MQAKLLFSDFADRVRRYFGSSVTQVWGPFRGDSEFMRQSLCVRRDWYFYKTAF